MVKMIAILLVALGAIANPTCAKAEDKPRLIVLSDIGNEPDDQMSLVRLLLYSNEIDIVGLVATTSTWQRDKVSPDIIRSVVEAYGLTVPSLRRHAKGWPDASALNNLISSGVAGYGLAASEATPLSDGAKALIAAADAPDPRPLHVSLWGGANTLAQALSYVRRTRSPAETAALIGKMRIYSISDQDDAGPWIRRQFPMLFYIVQPSTPTGEDYAAATWTGISGDRFYRNGDGADFTTVTNEWLEEHIRGKGPLGRHYPRYLYIMEGDTPAFLGLIPNGLQNDDRPNWGGWGGRYVLRTPYGESRPIWTQGGDAGGRVTSADTIGEHTSDQATIWRWRNAFQNDFAARMDWTIRRFAAANHPPVIVVNGRSDTAPIMMDATVGRPVEIDASATRDPDDDRLTYQWFQYSEAGFGDGSLADVSIANATDPKVTIIPTATCRPTWTGVTSCPKNGVVHIILSVTDAGSPALTRYRRIVLRVNSIPS